MSQKRKHGEAVESSDGAPKPFKKQRAFTPGSNHHAKHKRPHPSNDDDDNGRSINALKSRIRDLKRLLAHIDNVPKHKMSAGARQERERELEASEHELAEKISANREAEYKQKMIGKYHQVRFFDRQKASRILKRMKKEHATLEDATDRAELRQKIHNAEVDVNYAIYYPLMKPYSALYPKSKNSKTSEDEDSDSKPKNNEVDGPKGDVEMWKAVETAMEENTLKDLRYSKEAVPAAPPKKSKATLEKSQKKRLEKKEKAVHDEPLHRRARRARAQEEDDESDGGFFGDD